jgi:hypothetical protein
MRDPVPPPANLDAERLSNAMGWVPLFRSYLRVAKDPRASTDAATEQPYVPLVGAPPARPQNQRLRDGIRFLFDLP